MLITSAMKEFPVVTDDKDRQTRCYEQERKIAESPYVPTVPDYIKIRDGHVVCYCDKEANKITSGTMKNPGRWESTHPSPHLDVELKTVQGVLQMRGLEQMCETQGT